MAVEDSVEVEDSEVARVAALAVVSVEVAVLEVGEVVVLEAVAVAALVEGVV